jgi:hypothetical protein
MITISQHQFRRWSKRFSELDLQIFRLSLACDVNTVCGKDKPRVFVTLRALLMLRYALQTTAVAELGSSGVLRIANYTQVWLRERIGGNAK